MLLPQLGAFAFLALRVDTAELQSSDAVLNDVAVDLHHIPIEYEAYERYMSTLATVCNAQESSCSGGESSTLVLNKDANGISQNADQDGTVSQTVAAHPYRRSTPSSRVLIEVPRIVNHVDLEAGARELIALTGAFNGGHDHVNSEKLFGVICEHLNTETERKFSIATLPKLLAKHTMDAMRNNRKLHAYLYSTYSKLSLNWVSSIRQAANAIRENFTSSSLTRESKDALSDMVRCTNDVLQNVIHILHAVKASDIYVAENAAESEVLLCGELSKYEKYTRRLFESKSNEKYSLAVAVAVSVNIAASTGLIDIRKDIRHLNSENRKHNPSMTERMVGSIPALRSILDEYPWMTEFNKPFDLESLESASIQLHMLATEINHMLSTTFAIVQRKVNVGERKLVLGMHENIQKLRYNFAIDLSESLSLSTSSNVVLRTTAFVNELFGSCEITRPLNDEEAEIVRVFEKITGKQQHKIKLATKSHFVALLWDEARNSECMQLLDAQIATAQEKSVVHDDKTGDTVSELESAVSQLKKLLTERVEIIHQMRDIINGLVERKTVSDIAKRYKAVKSDIEALQKSIITLSTSVSDIVSHDAASQSSNASSDASLSVLVPLRADIATAESIEAVHRVIANAAENADHQESCAKSQASALARQISIHSNNAETARLAWFDLISRILTHTSRMEEILNAAFKANRALNDGELRQTGIRLENIAKISAEIQKNVDLEQGLLAEIRAAKFIQAAAIARGAAFSKLSTQSRLKAIVIDGASP